MARVGVLLSGGVDSAFAALRLVELGHDVEGFTAVLNGEYPSSSSESVEAARGICRALAIPHTEVDLREEFSRLVLRPFTSSYAEGMTPNPCAWCNRDIKLGELAKSIMDKGFDLVATGHYARLGDVGGRRTLCEPLDSRKSQVYFLALVDPGVLRFLVFPLGDFRKAEVTRLVGEAGLTARVGDSQDLCFVTRGKYHDFLGPGGRPPGTGEVLDMEGNVVATHRGHTAYTVGQRFGVRGKRYYVVEKRPETNVLVIGDRDRALKTEITASGINWFLPQEDCQPDRLSIRYRYNSPAVGARILRAGRDRVTVLTDEPCFAPAPGQVLASYRNGCLLFGGIIQSA
jgi:tRNA-specific 2-thiouridylase